MIMFTKREISVLHHTKRVCLKTLQDNLKQIDYDHITSRIKTNDSITNKLIRKGIDAPTTDDALTYLSDVIGIRIVTQYINEIYDIVDCIKQRYEVLEEIDYITSPKESGYRSFHIIIDFPIYTNGNPFPYCTNVPIEIQIRTMGMDFWASLEHSIIYNKKKNLPNQNLDNNVITLIDKELINYADEIFSIDMRIQALKHISEHALPKPDNTL